MDALPIDAALPALAAALREGPNAVLEAPPGAGKTTRVPLALLTEPWAAGGRIVMLEPRRLAARAAAARMAATLGEPVGRTVGFRIRGETRVSAATRIEVVTEGVLTRMLLADPGLEGVAAAIFDEAHERSIHGDLGLALCLESQGALRPDLRLVAMSATLDAAPFAAAMGDAPRVRAEGRAFPVETRWLDAPLGPGARIEGPAAELILAGLAAAPGDLLAFLPGVGEIGRVAARLAGRLPPDVDLREIHGDLPLERQQAALGPAAPGRRKAVLATAIAETSLTVEGVRIVVDAGRARRARFDPGSGMSRLVTERVTRAEADQRRGRAGRLAPGLCLRLWTRGEEGGLAPFPPPEILAADLAPLALDLALWGAREPGALRFLDPPPASAFAEARALLAGLGALDAGGAPTPLGRRMAALPLHPRLARMVLAAPAAEAATARALAAIMAERDPLRAPGAAPPADLSLRLEAVADPRAFAVARGHALDPAALGRIAETRRRLDRDLGPAPGRIDPGAAGRLAALAWPDRVGKRRAGEAPRFLLANGKGAATRAEEPLGAAAFLATADLDGDPREAMIRLAAPLTRAEIEALFAERIVETRAVGWDARARAVTAAIERRLGALTLDRRPLADLDPTEAAAAMAEGVRALGLGALPWTEGARRLAARVVFARAAGAALPDFSEGALLDGLDAWLGPALAACRREADLARLDLAAALAAALGPEGRRRLDAAAPEALDTPAGARRPIDYGRAAPTVTVRPQELYGLDRHPTAAGRPLLLELVSPAGRPIAATSDLPGFWRGGWADARRDMRGRYPRHDWPERPWEAQPTTRAKPRG